MILCQGRFSEEACLLSEKQYSAAVAAEMNWEGLKVWEVSGEEAGEVGEGTRGRRGLSVGQAESSSSISR